LNKIYVQKVREGKKSKRSLKGGSQAAITGDDE